METQKRELFRKESLERLASPEKLDQLMVVVTLKEWLILGTLGLLVGGALIWSIFGRVAVNVQGRGAFINPSISLSAEANVVDFQAPGSGLLLSLRIKRGDFVRKGQVLGLIDHPELRKQIQIEQERLAELLAQDHTLKAVQGQKLEIDKQALAKQAEGFKSELRRSRELMPVLVEKNLYAIREQRKNLQERLRDAKGMTQTLKEGFEARQKLKQAGLISDSLFINAQRDYLGALDQSSQLVTQMRELDTREAELRKGQLSDLSRISGLQSQLKDIGSRQKLLEVNQLQDQNNVRTQIGEIKRHIKQLESELQYSGEIKSEISGRVFEITAILGQMVSQGTRLGSINLEGEGRRDELESVAYFTIGEGRRIFPGMKVQVTPDTVKREEFGGIDGTVVSVSEYPVTVEGIANVVNNQTMAQSLIEGGKTIEVFIKLKRDPNNHSGYHWGSSKGPSIKLGPGITDEVRVTVEERAPITYLLPILRTAAGV